MDRCCKRGVPCGLQLFPKIDPIVAVVMLTHLHMMQTGWLTGFLQNLRFDRFRVIGFRHGFIFLLGGLIEFCDNSLAL
ncbi:hypothetical protein Q31b_54430 [Novipirellula aureliae]|uniref:Uncharacterized protein n=1 Tax=Novipirellula aureliae TaxID=2527966 RepID=A0A5C6DHN0_9BACT|nr:hypothetical protein Q31b_54430 [Novipirellula aureliae]